MLGTACLRFHLEARGIQNKLTSGNDENTMRLLGHQLCHTDCWNETDWQSIEGKTPTSFLLVLERCASPTQDVSILLKSTCFQSSQECATHQSHTALDICSEDNQRAKISSKENFREYFNLQSKLLFFLACSMPFKHKNKNRSNPLT